MWCYPSVTVKPSFRWWIIVADFSLNFSVFSVAECDVIVVGRAGQNATLPCHYDRKHHGALSFCWGRGQIPSSGYSNDRLISSDGTTWTPVSSRYQLLGRLDQGDVSMTILNLREEDAGQYGCRVEISGWFNDQKEQLTLTVTGETWSWHPQKKKKFLL